MESSKVDVKIINLSSVQLDTATVSLLRRGLKFTPTPNRNSVELSKDIREFSRNLKLLGFFSDNDYNTDSLARNKSTFNPRRGLDRNLDMCTDQLHALSTSLLHDKQSQYHKKSNLSLNEQRAMTKLRNNKELVLRSADKGNGLVLLNSEDYKQKCLNMLQDTSTYTVVEDTRDHVTMKTVIAFTEKFSNLLREDEQKYLTRFEARTSNFYGLPKVHKSSKIIEVSNTEVVTLPCPEDLSFRPIVGGPNSPTHRLSNFIDILLKPYTTEVDSYIKDTTDFLRTLPQTIEEDIIFISFDVKSMYTNITEELGLKAIEYWLEKCPTLLNARFNKEFVMEGIKIILKNNVFYFDGQLYRQLKGCSMGSKVSPTYATLTVGYLEVKLYNRIRSERNEEFASYIQKNLKRFLDDIFLVFKARFGPVSYIQNLLNEMDPNLQFTMEQDNNSLPFLDVMVYRENQQIKTDIFYKATDTHNFLRFDSCHPKHTKISIPYSQAKRICLIVSDEQRRDKRLKELEQFFINQKYPKNIIKKGIERARNVDRTQLFTRKEQSTSTQLLPFVRTYNPNNANVGRSIQESLGVLKTDEKWTQKLQNRKFINSYRNSKSLGRILTRSRFDSSVSPDTGSVQKCGDLRCGCCAIINETTCTTFEDGTRFNIRSKMNCSSRNLIYKLNCTGCSRTYIGQTGNTLRKRVTVHRQQVQDSKYRILPVSQHIADCSDYDVKFIVTPFYKMPPNSTEIDRETKETWFINKFKPTLNSS